MITLKNDFLSIQVHPENKIYEVLKKFSGESFTVFFEETNDSLVVEEKPKKQVIKEDVRREKVWESFYKDLDSLLDPPTLVGNILKSHTMNALNGETGMVKMEKVEANLFKNNDLYLIVRD